MQPLIEIRQCVALNRVASLSLRAIPFPGCLAVPLMKGGGYGSFVPTGRGPEQLALVARNRFDNRKPLFWTALNYYFNALRSFF